MSPLLCETCGSNYGETPENDFVTAMIRARAHGKVCSKADRRIFVIGRLGLFWRRS
jgi:hypothetical protein